MNPPNDAVVKDVAKDTEALRRDLEQLRNDFAAMGRTVKGLAGEVGSETYARVRDRADKARAQAGKAADTVAQTIEDRPLASILVAFAVGLILGILFGRQR
jgi:ElaB/YqjD/DUF883 family membrane-anchored ribosome-binding protein